MYITLQPTSMRAIRARYNPYLQTRHRVEQVGTCITLELEEGEECKSKLHKKSRLHCTLIIAVKAAGSQC